MSTDEIVRELRAAAAKWEAENKFIGTGELRVHDALNDAADLIKSLQAQLADEKRKERAAVADLEYACGSSGEFELRSICDICRRKQTNGTCPTQCEMNSLAASNKWEWRGPQEAEKGEQDE